MDVLNALYACDDNYAPFACVSICSLLENNQSFDEINIYVVLDNVCRHNLDLLRTQIEQYHARFIPVDAEGIIAEIRKIGIPMYRNSYATNYRLFFHRFMADSVERFIYLDCDTIIVDDIKEIYLRDMGNMAAMVVQDALTVEYKRIIGMQDQDKYFNAGVMIINQMNWRKEKCLERMLEHMEKKRAAYCNPDQDILNIILKDKVIYLAPEYNSQPIHRALKDSIYQRIYRNPSYYSPEELDYARKHPRILHTYRFMGEFPWHLGNVHPDTAVFDEYMQKSCQRGYVKTKAQTGILFKTEKLLYQLLPKPIFYYIFKHMQNLSMRMNNRRLVKGTAK